MANEKQNQEWDSLGRSIEEIIDKAINSQNYQELSRNITRTIDRATRTGSDALWRALDMSGATKPKKNITVEPVRAEPVSKNNLPALYGSSNGETTKGHRHRGQPCIHPLCPGTGSLGWRRDAPEQRHPFPGAGQPV